MTCRAAASPPSNDVARGFVQSRRPSSLRFKAVPFVRQSGCEFSALSFQCGWCDAPATEDAAFGVNYNNGLDYETVPFLRVARGKSLRPHFKLRAAFERFPVWYNPDLGGGDNAADRLAFIEQADDAWLARAANLDVPIQVMRRFKSSTWGGRRHARSPWRNHTR